MKNIKKQWRLAYQLRRIGFSIVDASDHPIVRKALRISTGDINNGGRHYKHSMMPPTEQTPIATDFDPVEIAREHNFHPSKECELWCHSRQQGFTDEDCNCW